MLKLLVSLAILLAATGADAGLRDWLNDFCAMFLKKSESPSRTVIKKLANSIESQINYQKYARERTFERIALMTQRLDDVNLAVGQIMTARVMASRNLDLVAVHELAQVLAAAEYVHDELTKYGSITGLDLKDLENAREIYKTDAYDLRVIGIMTDEDIKQGHRRIFDFIDLYRNDRNSVSKTSDFIESPEFIDAVDFARLKIVKQVSPAAKAAIAAMTADKRKDKL